MTMVNVFNKIFNKKKNKVHFYVARDETGELYLYLSKPFRSDSKFYDDPDKGVLF